MFPDSSLNVINRYFYQEIGRWSIFLFSASKTPKCFHAFFTTDQKRHEYYEKRKTVSFSHRYISSILFYRIFTHNTVSYNMENKGSREKKMERTGRIIQNKKMKEGKIG